MVQACTQDTLNPLDKGIFTLFEAVFIFCNFKIFFIKLTFRFRKFKFNNASYVFRKKTIKIINFQFNSKQFRQFCQYRFYNS